MSELQVIILPFILSLGMAWPIWAIYKHFRLQKVSEIEEGENITMITVIIMCCYMVNLLWFVPRIVITDIVTSVSDAERQNCAQSYYRDGKEFTEDQCYFFRDVLHGKYNDYKTDFDIQSYIKLD